MTAIGGQALPSDQPIDEEAFRKIAGEIGVDPDVYVEALYRVPAMPESKIRACADLLGGIIDIFINQKYLERVCLMNPDRVCKIHKSCMTFITSFFQTRLLQSVLVRILPVCCKKQKNIVKLKSIFVSDRLS